MTTEYKNDFLSIIVQPFPARGSDAYLCCFSINLSRFRPLSQGRYGICSNPAFKGLQLLRADVSAFAIKNNVTPRSAEDRTCTGISPAGEGRYHETLLIEDASDRFPAELLRFSVRQLLEKVLSVCVPDLSLPDDLSDPGELQRYLESLTVKTG